MSAPQLPRPAAPAVQQIGGAVLVQGGAVRDLVYALGRAIKLAPTEGQGRHVARLEAFRAMALQAFEFQTSAAGHPDIRSALSVRKYKADERDWVDTNEAAELSGYTPRHCRRLAREVFGPDGKARPAGKSWVIDRNTFDAYMLERNVN